MDRLTRASRRDQMPEYSPDGRRIAFVSDRSSALEIYVANADGQDAVQLTDFRGPSNLWPRWSPDGQRVVFSGRPNGNPDVYEVPISGGPPRRLTNDLAADFWPSYSRDGAWIYYSSNRHRMPWTIWKLSSNGSGQPERLPMQFALTTRESPDGRFLYYSRSDQDGIWRVPTRSGTAAKVIDTANRRDWTMTVNGIYFREPAGAEIKYYSFATQTVSLVGTPPAKYAMGTGLAVSPDDRWLVYPRYDQVIGDIILVENYR
jgi:dipeptidyl aminopeptidase/acylaminoacyl peptidase